MKNIQKVIILVLVLFVGIFYFNSSSKQKVDLSVESVKIGGIFALTGLGASQGEQEKRGAELAVKQINEKGGINGHTLVLISEDVSLDKLNVAGSAAHKLIDVDNVKAIVGTTWDEPAQAILPIIEAAKVPMIGQNQTRQLEKEKAFDYFFSTWYNNEVGVDELLKFAKDSGFKKIAIIRPIPVGFYQFVSDLINQKAESYGLTITDNINANNVGMTDIRTIITKIKSNKPDAVITIVSSFTECSYLKQARDQELNVPLITTESARDISALKNCPSLMENAFISYPKITERYNDFEKDFEKVYGTVPETPSVMTSYDAVMIIADALKKTNGEGGEKLKDVIAHTKDFKGVSLPNITFDNIGFVITPADAFEMQTVRDSEFVRVSK